jgi:hypothetical protein
MSLEDYVKLYKKSNKWSLQNMIRALSRLELLNTEEDNLRLKAAKIAIKTMR